MKRYVWSLIALAFVVNASEFVVVEESKNNQTEIKKLSIQKPRVKRAKNRNFELIKVREGNRTRNMIVPIEDVALTGITQQSALNSKLNSKDGLLITFKDKSIDIEAFEKKFNLKLQKKLQIGYYIFKNSSKFTDIILINSILASKEGSKIETIKPNWKMKMEKY